MTVFRVLNKEWIQRSRIKEADRMVQGEADQKQIQWWKN